MLREICVRNLALIEEARIEFCPGLNVLTGETGVGKSLLVGALALLLGGRASAEQVRSGAKDAAVDGVFDRLGGDLEKEVSALVGGEVGEGELLISRSVDTEGRSRCHINGRPVTVGMLRDVGRRLMEIHGQQDHENLLHASEQRLLLDRFGDLDGLRKEFEALYRAACGQRDRRDELAAQQEDRRRRAELLDHELAEIDAARLRAGEEEQLEAQRRLLANAERIKAAAQGGYEALYESEDSLAGRLKAIGRRLAEVAGFDAKLKEAHQACEQCSAQLEEIGFALRECCERMDVDGEGLNRIEERLDLIRRLRSKYGRTVEDILKRREEMAAERARLSGETEELASADEKLKTLVEEMGRVGADLSEKRKKAAARLGREVEEELKSLGMKQGRFEVAVVSSAEGDSTSRLDSAGATGFDGVEFMISPNVGEEVKPLRKIASGGEMSRIMLALKHRLAQADRTPILVFDEVDANVGGRVGRVIGEKLRGIGRSHQVFCVTHLPQIASYADGQYRVAKEVADGRTRCRIERLEGASRVEEIAHMIRGDRSSRITLDQAKEMLEDARSRK